MLLFAKSNDSLSHWDPFWKGFPDKFGEETMSLGVPNQVLNQEGFLSGKMDPNVDDVYSNNNKTR